MLPLSGSICTAAESAGTPVPAKSHIHFSATPDDKEIGHAHMLPSPLVADGTATPQKNGQFARVLEKFAERADHGDFSEIVEFVKSHPHSGWDVSLYANLGRLYYESGNFSKALDAWEQAWQLGKNVTDPKLKAVVDDAVGQLARMHARIGHYDRLEALQQELKGHQVSGAATEMLAGAAEGLWLMKNRPEEAFLCGPMAVGTVYGLTFPKKAPDPRIQSTQSTKQGTTLTQVRQLAQAVGLNYQMAKRQPGAAIIVPSIINWKVGHFAALVKRTENRTLIKDPTFGDEIWIRDRVLDTEASGYFLVPAGPLPQGWQAVSEAEGSTVWGRGNTGSTDCDSDKPCDKKNDGCCGDDDSDPPMAVARAHLAVVSLNITDTPAFITVPRGPVVRFKVTYNQRDAGQTTPFYYANLGPKWTCDWISYIEADLDVAGGELKHYLAGAGVERYSGDTYDGTSQSYAPQLYSQAVMVRTPLGFERHLSDGSKEIYDIPDGNITGRRKLFLRQIVDPQGNQLNYVYNSSLCLTEVWDSSRKVAELTYGLTTDPLKITQVTVFGPTNNAQRSASFEYTDGHLTKITDMIGIESHFDYHGDFIYQMTTPYGTSQFSYADVNTNPALDSRTRWLEMTDPVGGKQRIEYNELMTVGTAYSDPPELLPTGLYLRNSVLTARNTYYWDKKAMMTAPGDYGKAHLYHWLHFDGYAKSGSILESEKPALENRTWFNYPGQLVYTGGDQINETSTLTGTMNKPTLSARVMADGTTQLAGNEYSATGKVTKSVDPMGRETTYVYDSNGIDLLEVRNTTGGISELLISYTYTDATHTISNHKPLTMTDAAGQVSKMTYNAQGQVLTRTVKHNGVDETTSYTYDGNGYLQGVTGPLPGATVTFTYDDFGRTRNVTDSEAYTTTYDYDAIDRVTKITYPDGTYKQTFYHWLDAEWMRDRSGKFTHLIRDALRRVTQAVDPAGRTTKYDWCVCGALDALEDGAGHITRFAYDVQRRVIQTTYDDGSNVQFTYSPGDGRRTSVTDANGHVKHYAYYPDGDLKEISYTDAGGNVLNPPTQTVSYVYDPAYNRIVSMTDDTGVTQYGYYPVDGHTAGAGKLSSISGPLANSQITYQYDDLGRTIKRAVNGVGEGISYDALGRVFAADNPLGHFDYGYFNATKRLASMTFPNGQTTNYSYWPNVAAAGTGNGDQRLQTIWHQRPDGTNTVTLSKHDYAYDLDGEITTWTQQIDANPATQYAFSYDGSQQLLSATLQDPVSTSTLHQYSYAYDGTGGRTVEQLDNALTNTSYNDLNQLTNRIGAGAMIFEGNVNKPASVTVGGAPAVVDSSNNFRGTAVVTNGVQNVPITAIDAAGNTTIKHAQVNVTAGAGNQTFTYDANGNLKSDGSRTFVWDAANRLVKITSGTNVIEFVYNGAGQRICQLLNGEVKKYWIWDARDLLEERDETNAVSKRFYSQGEQISGQSFFFTRDHQGSIREMTDATASIRARYDYDPYGRRTRVSGDRDADMGFTGYYFHPSIGLYLTFFRAYDADLGRWLSRDPLGNRGKIKNLYDYCSGDPTNKVDLYGDEDYKCCDDATRAAGKQKLYDQAQKTLNSLQNPDNQDGADPLSCFDWNVQIFNSLVVPKCWSCTQVHGTINRWHIATIYQNGLYADHWVVRCSGKNQNGRIVEIIVLDATGGYQDKGWEAFVDFYDNVSAYGPDQQGPLCNP